MNSYYVIRTMQDYALNPLYWAGFGWTASQRRAKRYSSLYEADQHLAAGANSEGLCYADTAAWKESVVVRVKVKR